MKILLPLLLLLTAPAHADPLLYRIQDADSSLWLLGSVHALRPADYPLSDDIEHAYSDAERVVLEIDPAELDPASLAPIMLELARFERGQHLQGVLDGATFHQLENRLGALGLDAQQFQPYEPWFVALQVFALNLASNGFVGAEGVDRHYADLAKKDGKETGGLETAREQLGFFDSLPMATQKQFLEDTLDETDDFRAEMEKLVATWRRGDAAALEALIDREFAGEPELRRAVLEQRNRNWLEPISTLMQKPGDTLVIVGALHLVGDHGVIELLRRKGYDVERVSQN